MSSRVRRMALGLATLTLLMSLFLVAQGFLNAPEALASCPERTWCDPPYDVPTTACCCFQQNMLICQFQRCYWQEYDCTINEDVWNPSCQCTGSYCSCYYGYP